MGSVPAASSISIASMRSHASVSRAAGTHFAAVSREGRPGASAMTAPASSP
jgi:hypothetical protein